MKNFITVLFLTISIYSFGQEWEAHFVSRQMLGGTNYYLMVEGPRNGVYEIWFRESLNQSSPKDKSGGTLEVGFVSKEKAKQMLCDSYKFIDNAKTVLGCASTVGAVACLASGGGAGVLVPVCAISVNYALGTGAMDCLSGVAAKIGKAVGADYAGEAVSQVAGTMALSSVVEYGIKEACGQ